MTYDDQSSAIGVLIEGLNAGDDSAREALLECSRDRLQRLAGKMLKGYPGVARWEQADDVVQNALLRLDRALKSVVPPTPRDFFRLAATEVRRELIDLARKHFGPEGQGTHHWTPPQRRDLGRFPGGCKDPSDTTHNPVRLADWTEFHNRIEGLPDGDRELFDLLWYQGLTRGQAAVLLGVSEKTIVRRWNVAKLKLHEALGGELPV